MNLTYREATVNDAPSIVRQIQVSRVKSLAHNVSVERTTRRWRNYINRTHTPKDGKLPRVTYLAFANDTLVGHVACHHSTRHDCESELQSIHVLPEYQRTGLGTILLGMAVDWLVRTDITSMMVGFHPDNPYQQFYLKYGGLKTAPGRCEWHNLSQLQDLLKETHMETHEDNKR